MSVLNDRHAPATANRKPVRGKMSCCRHPRPEKCMCNMTRAMTEKRASKLSAAAAVADILSCGTCPDPDRSRIARAVRMVRKTSDKNPRLHSNIRDRRTMRSCHDILTALLCVQDVGEKQIPNKRIASSSRKDKSNCRFLSQLERSQIILRMNRSYD